MGRSPDAAIFAFSFLLPAGGGGGGGVAHFRVVSDCQTLPLSHISRRHFSYTVCVSYAQKAKGRREKDDNKSLRFSGSLLLLGRGTVYAAAACELDGKGGRYTYIAKNGNGRQTKTGLHGAAEEKKDLANIQAFENFAPSLRVLRWRRQKKAGAYGAGSREIDGGVNGGTLIDKLWWPGRNSNLLDPFFREFRRRAKPGLLIIRVRRRRSKIQEVPFARRFNFCRGHL